jgi:Tfp pilus assembly protein PilZ
LSCVIAEKVLLRSLTEIAPAPDVAAGALPDVAAGAELVAGAEVVELLELQAATASNAAAAAAAVSPARADTEYNGVPRSFTQTHPGGHVREQIRITRTRSSGLFAEIVGLPGETLPLTLS